MHNLVLCTKQSNNKYVTYNVCELACDSHKSATHSQALHCKHNTREAMSNTTCLKADIYILGKYKNDFDYGQVDVSDYTKEGIDCTSLYVQVGLYNWFTMYYKICVSCLRRSGFCLFVMMSE